MIKVDVISGFLGAGKTTLIKKIFETILKEWESGSKTRINRCNAQLYRIFEQIQIKDQSAEQDPPKSIKEGAERLRSDFRNPALTIDGLARMCHVSGTYFRRVYKDFYGISPMQALADLRFAYAKELLATGYFSVKEIALSSGFSDVKYFRRAFKVKYGLTPNEYIKSIWE